MIEKHRARINIKSLAAEAAIIKREISRVSKRHSAYAENLRHHKVMKVKPEARLAQLALAFLKGIPRKVCETSEKPVDIKKLHGKITKFCDFPCKRLVTFDEVSEWTRS